jgi:enoyl-CoA hydratase
VIRLDVDGAIAVVTIDRPEARNSLDPPHILDLARAWDRIRDDPAIRCGVVTGAGDTFSAGMDLKKTIPAAAALARRERIPPETFEALRRAADALLAGYDIAKPMVAAIDGPCLAGGADMVIATDVRYASPRATFNWSEVALGLFPRGNATVLLPRQIGWVHALDLLLTGRTIDAAEARRIGLVNDVVDDPLARALETARAIAANAPLAVLGTKRALREQWAMDLPAAYAHQQRLANELMKSADASEGARAFAERRPPRFEGR